jgi:hypothetical protein
MAIEQPVRQEPPEEIAPEGETYIPPDEGGDVLDLLKQLIEVSNGIREAVRGRPDPQLEIAALPFVSKSRLFRCQQIVLSVSKACSVTLQYGAAVLFTWDFPGAEAHTFPLPRVFDRGVDVIVLGTLDAVVHGYLVGVPE